MAAPIGFIGLGNIGMPVAANLATAGHAVLAFDSDPAALARAAEHGISAASSARAVAEAAAVVFLSLPTPAVVEQVVLGEEGVARGSTLRCLIDLSTSGPRTARKLAAAMAERGGALLEAPVSGGVAGARAGTLAIMVSGPRMAFDEVASLLSLLGRPVFVGEAAGLAQTMKLVNNMVAGAALAITAEAMAMGAKAGLDPEVMLEVLNAGSGRNTATADKFPRAVLTGSYDFGFAAELMLKDNSLFIDEAQAMGLDLPACREMVARWQDTVADLGPCDFTAIARLLERRAGVSLRAKRQD
jgi:3-hydroxyisobutyrate dehydrogenase-like beta-hydroxyacid dehydrogenase